jgi:hypothetical protein
MNKNQIIMLSIFLIFSLIALVFVNDHLLSAQQQKTSQLTSNNPSLPERRSFDVPSNGRPVPYQYKIGLYNNTESGVNTTISAFTTNLQEKDVTILNVYEEVKALSLELPHTINETTGIIHPFNITSSNGGPRNITLADIVNIFLPNNTAAIITGFNVSMGTRPISTIPATNDTDVCNIIKLNPNVRYCEPVTIIGPFSAKYSDPSIPLHIKRVGAVHNETIDLGNSPIKVVILDSGITPHPDLNIVNSTSFVPVNNDDCGHGTHVAGIVGAKDRSANLIGVAPGVKLWSIKIIYWHFNPFELRFDCYGTSDNLAAGLRFIVQHADQIDIVNLSGGSNRNDTTIDDLTKEAVRRGVTFVTAAGNSAKDAKNVSPAHLSDVITVSAIVDSDGRCGNSGKNLTAADGSLNTDDSYAKFSNFGRAITIAAPGVHINSTWPDGSTKILDGTSQAAPQVAGAAALVKLTDPASSPAIVKERLLALSTLHSSICDGYARGYFMNNPNNPPEPLLYVETLY